MKTCLSALGSCSACSCRCAQKAPLRVREPVHLQCESLWRTGDGRTYDDAAINTASRAVKAAGAARSIFPAAPIC